MMNFTRFGRHFASRGFIAPVPSLRTLAAPAFDLVRPMSTQVTSSKVISSPTPNAQKPMTTEEYNLKLKQMVSFFNAKEKPLVLRNVLGLCDSMKKLEVAPNVSTYNYLLEALATKNQVLFAMKMLEEMKKMNLVPNLTTLNLVLKIHISFGDFLHAMEIYELFDTYSITPDSETFLHLIGVAANSPKHRQKVSNLVNEMLARGLYTIEGGSKAIDSLVYHESHEEALALLKHIEQTGNTVSNAAYSSLLSGLCAVDHVEGVNHCFKALRAGKLTDVVLDEGLILTILLHARRVGNLTLAHHAVLALEEIKPVFHDFHFIPLLDLLAREGSFFRVFEVIMLMKSMGIELKLKSFTEVINQIAKSTETMDKAYFALEDLKSQKKLDIFVFNMVLAGCAQGRDLDRTFATFSEAETLGLTPDIESYHRLFDACIRTKQSKVAERVWKEMEKSGLQPVAETYTRYIDTHTICGNLGLARAAFEAAISKDLVLHDKVYDHLMQRFERLDKEFVEKVASLKRSRNAAAKHEEQAKESSA